MKVSLERQVRRHDHENLETYSKILVLYCMQSDFAALSVASQLYVPILTGNAIDHMIGVGKVDFVGVAAIVRVIVAATAVTAISQWIFGICNNKITYNVSRDLRNAAIAKIQRLPVSYLDAHPTGDLVSRVIADVEQFADGL